MHKTNRNKATVKPTAETCTEMQIASDFFNPELFGDQLPACLITDQRRWHTLGYFSRDRWSHRSTELNTDEIAMNPEYFWGCSLAETCSTLVHQMAHLWQHRGPSENPGRGGYHNRQWGDLMEGLGLLPSHTGQLGGRATGDKMSLFILEDGPLVTASEKLADSGFHLSGVDRAGLARTSRPGGRRRGVLRGIRTGTNRSNREKYICPNCGLNAWAKPKCALIFGFCQVLLRDTADSSVRAAAMVLSSRPSV